MTISGGILRAEAIVDVVRQSWPAVALVDEPQLIVGGQWATMYRLRITGTPADVPDDLVLRVAPHAEMAAKEQAVQAAAANAGIATPHIHLTGPDGGPLHGAWAIMDFAPGAPLLTDLDGIAALGHLPGILRRLPRQLADAMASIHRLDPNPVVEQARATAPTVALTIDELWPNLRAGTDAAARPDLADAIERLAEAKPPQDGPVVCHGDLHPLNLLAAGPTLTIIDWTGAIVAPPAFDVAFTALLLGHPPLPTPTALRPALRAGAAVVARRFTRLYQRANPAADLAHLDWYTALHAARILTDHATWISTDDPRAQRHPFHLIAPNAALDLRRTTGVDITPN